MIAATLTYIDAALAEKQRKVQVVVYTSTLTNVTAICQATIYNLQ